MAENSITTQIEIHYYFSEDDKSHSMDAITRNRCEHELLQIANEISKELDTYVKIETEAYDEGGLREFYTFISTPQGQGDMIFVGIIVAIFAIIISRIPPRRTKIDKLEQELNIEDMKLSIKERKLRIELLKQELEARKIDTTNISIDKIEYLVTNNIKIIKHKSNFYKTLYKYPKVKSLSATRINESKNQIETPKVVERKDFDKFFLDSDNLKPVIDENATIEIISPVLKKGKYKWRGIYSGVPYPIEFSMKDEPFKDSIIEEGVPFKSGTFIDCVFEIARKVDDLGNVFNSNYSVITVLNQHEDGISIETPQGAKYRKKREAERTQLGLFDNPNEVK